MAVRPHRPADECPFSKPFPDNFDECPAYQPSEFVGLDLQYHPLPAVWTCSHLEINAHTSGSHGFYPRCRLGDAAARMRWVQEVDAVRLDALRRLQREFAEAMRPGLAELWTLKGNQLKALRSSADGGHETAQLQAYCARLLTRIEAFFEDRTDLLLEINLPLDPLMQVMSSAFSEFIEQRTAGSDWEVPDHILERFPKEVRLLFRPDQIAS